MPQVSEAPRLEGSRRAGASIVVTGGTRRLGRFICEAIAEAGYDLVATYSDDALTGSPELAEFQVSIQARYGVACALVCADLRNPPAEVVASIFDACPSPLFGLVNNAGLFKWDNIDSLDRALIQELLSINLIAPMLVTSEFSKRMTRTAAPGIVVTMLDQKIFNPYPDHLTYTVCKSALSMLTTMCAREPGKNLKFYGLAPGLVIPAPGQSVPDFVAAQRSVPLERSPTTDEIKRCIAFLLSGIAVNGFVLVIDGGASLVRRERDFAFFEARN